MGRDKEDEGSEPEQWRYSETEPPREKTPMHGFGTLPAPRWGAKKLRSLLIAAAADLKVIKSAKENAIISSSQAAKKPISCDLNLPPIDEEEGEKVNSLPITRRNDNEQYSVVPTSRGFVETRSKVDENDLDLVERPRKRKKKVNQIKSKVDENDLDLVERPRKRKKKVNQIK